MEPERATSGLRSFATIAFVLLMVIGILSAAGGFMLIAMGASDLATTALLSGAILILAAFGVRLVLFVLANMADDVHASRELLSSINDKPSGNSPSAAAKATAAAATAATATRKSRLPMPPSRGSGTTTHDPTKPKIPMPPLRGSGSN